MTTFDPNNATRESMRKHAAENEAKELALDVYLIQRLLDAGETIPIDEVPDER